MKISSTFLFSILFFFSCSESSIETSDEYSYDIQVSEIPIVLNKSCLARSIYTNLDTENSKEGLVVEAFLDSTYLIKKDLTSKGSAIRIDLPEEGAFKNLKIQIKKGEHILTEKLVPIKYVNQNDIVEFVKFNIEKPLPIYGFKNACWPNYTGPKIAANEGLEVNSTSIIETTIKGDSFTRKIIFKDVKLTNLENGKDILIEPSVDYSIEGVNFLNLKNSTKVHSTQKSLSKVADAIKDAQNEHGIPVNNSKTEILSLLRSDGSGGPSFRVMGYEYGRLFKGKVLDCNNFDTLINESLILPDFVQLELNCK